jgi:DNA-binding IclR family transcriptional regulator
VAARSGLSREKLHEKFKALRWERPPKFEEWYADVERVRREGVAVDRGNYVRGVTVVASLIPPAPDGATRGIALIGFEHKMIEKQLREARQDLMVATEAIVAKLS